MRTIAFLLSLSVVLVGAPRASAQEPSFKDLLAECLPGIGSENIPDNQAAQQRLQDACYALGATGQEAARADACREILKKLSPDVPRPARLWLLKQVQWIGREECVETLAALIKDKDPLIRDAALRALQSNPTPQANAQLVAALGAASDPDWRTALILALGFRGESASVPALAPLLSAEPAIAAVAAQSLGKIGCEAAAQALSAAYEQARPELRPAIGEAWLCSADRLLKAGQTADAAAVYLRLADAQQPRPVRLAAMKGRLVAAGDQATPLVLEMLASHDADAQAVAGGFVVELRGAGVLPALSAGLPKLPPAAQVMVLAGLAARGDRAAMPLAVTAARASQPEIRTAGILALSRLGDGTVVPLLLEILAANNEATPAARECLERICGEGVDEALIVAMQSSSPAQRKGLIELLEKRQCTAAVPALLADAQTQDKDLRPALLRALGNLAQPKDVPALVALLLKTPRGKDRDDVEKLVMFACSRGEDPQTLDQPVLAIFQPASAEDRLALLPALGRVGGKRALQTVLEAIGSSDANLRDAGVRALCNWPDASVADELLKLAAGAPDKAHQTAALRAYVRVISQTGKEGDTKTLDKFKKAMDMAIRTEDKKYLLSRVSNVRNVKTLRWVVPYLDDPTLATEAGRSVVELAHRRELMEPNHREFTAALQKVLEVSKDAATLEKAKRIMQGL